MNDDVWLEAKPELPAPAGGRPHSAPPVGWVVSLVLGLTSLAIGVGWLIFLPAQRRQVVDAAASVSPTPSAAVRPSATANHLLPNLRVVAVRLEPGVAGACQQAPSLVGVRAWVENAGVTRAGPFAISINGAVQLVPGLGPGEALAVWQEGAPAAAVVAVDVLNQVVETDKADNGLREPLAAPTDLPPCRPTAVPMVVHLPKTPTAEAPVAPTETLATFCPGALPSQLRVGLPARVSRFPSLSVRLRREPDLKADILGLAPPGEHIKIIDGPRCASGMVWWKIVPATPRQMVMGWASEGDVNGYWLIPDDGKGELLPPFAEAAGSASQAAPLPSPPTPSRQPAAAATVAPTPAGSPSQAPTPAAPATPTLATLPAARQIAVSPPTYVIQNGAPDYLPNFANASGCSWQGVVGQVFDREGLPVKGYRVVVDGGGQHQESVTGSKPELGPAGYAVTLGARPQATTQAYVIQLFDAAGQARSAPLNLATYSDCQRNLALVVFVPEEPQP